jgi:hypothetical protein
MAGGRDLNRYGRGQVSGRREHPTGRNRSHGRGASRDAVHAPANACVARVRNVCSERRCISQHHAAARRPDRHHDGWRRWRWREACASSAAAECPCSRHEESNKSDFRRPRFPSGGLQKGKHALGKAGEGPAKEKTMVVRSRTPGGKERFRISSAESVHWDRAIGLSHEFLYLQRCSR